MTHALWLDLFAFVVYALALIILWVTYKKDGLFFAGLPLVFVIYFLLSELLATQGGLPYKYGALPGPWVCIDLLLHPWFTNLAGYFFGSNPAAALVEEVEKLRAAGLPVGYQCSSVPACVPFAVPVMEGFTAFGILRTGMLLAPPRWFQPFMAAMVAVAIDWILDPTHAVSEWCGAGPGLPVKAAGIEFWRWFVWGHYEPSWHGIPLINFGAWFFGTVGITTAALLVIRYWNTLPSSALTDIALIILLLILTLLLGLHLEKLAFAWMGQLFASYDSAGQWGFMIFWMGTAAAGTIYFASSFQQAPFRWEWLPLPGLLVVSSLIGLFIAGPHALFSLLFVCWLVIVLLLVLFTLWPYRP